MKKSSLFLLMSCVLLPQLLAENSSSVPRLTGIINLPNQKSVVLECDRPGSVSRPLILSESQREGAIEVIRIKPESSGVELRIGGTNVQLVVRPPGEGALTPVSRGGLMLVNADIDPVLSLYARFKSRTLLRSPRLPATSFTLATSATNQAQAAVVLEKVLAEKGIASIPDEEKFLMVVPVSESAHVKPRSSEIRNATDDGNRPELLPVGAIYFSNADLSQAAQIYAELIGRKLDPTQR